MKDILFNVALFSLIDFCKAHDLDCSGSKLIKDGRGFSYMLVRVTDDEPIARVTLTKNSRPKFGWA